MTSFFDNVTGTRRTQASSIPFVAEGSPAYEIEELRNDNLGECLRLLNTQAVLHSSQVSATPRKFGPQGMQGFLVIHTETGQAVGLATIFKSLRFGDRDRDRVWGAPILGANSPQMTGIYLDDIVVDENFRNNRVGKFIIQNLADITVQSGGSCIELECLRGNQSAQGFYSHLGAAQFDDRQTWRRRGLLEGAKCELTGSRKAFDVHEMQPDEAEKVSAMFTLNGCVNPFLAARLRCAAAQDDLAVVVSMRHGEPKGLALLQREYTSFGNANGIHAAVRMGTTKPAAASAVLSECAEIQESRGWDSHFDITISKSSENTWKAEFSRHKIERLSYGHDEMTVRSFHGTALHNLAIAGRATDCPAKRRLIASFSPRL